MQNYDAGSEDSLNGLVERGSVVSMTIRTVIIDDEPLVRRSILRVLRADREIEILGEYGDGL
jgi:hypothetical protein